MGKFIFASLLILAVAGFGFVGCSSSDDDSSAGPTTTITLGDTTSESIESGITNNYEFTAGSETQVSVQTRDVSTGNAFEDLDLVWDGFTFCLSSGDYMTCTIDGVTPNASNTFGLTNNSSGTITFDLSTVEVSN